MATISDRLRPLFAGIERADSVAADPHKWLYVPYSAGATLVREPGRLADAFRRPAEYLVHDPDSPVNGPVSFNDRGPELSRGFRALKVYMGLKVHGRRAYAEAVERDCALARHLAGAVDAHPDFERLAEPALSIVNFRYRPAGTALEDRALDALNQRIVNGLVAGGGFFLAPTRLKGRVSMRVCIVNFRTTPADLDALLTEAARLGRTLQRSG
jgi:glutamate/tyrosine decarboxylase-like PLP-dependent enzyme